MTPTKADPLDSMPGQGPGHLASFTVLASGMAWAILLLLLAFIVPRVEAIFRDFGVPLPRLTEALVRISHAFQGPFLIVAAALIVIVVSAIERLRRLDGNTHARWAVLAILVPVGLIVAATLALGIAMLDLNHRLIG